jgi:amidase
VAASLCAAAVGTETDGSIVCPSAVNGVVGIKPTVGLTSRAGVVPISHTQDSVGPHGRTVADVAVMLGALAGGAPDARDPATARAAGKAPADYTRFLDRQGLKGARLGVPREVFFGYHERIDAVAEAALRVMKDEGAVIVDPADVPGAATMNHDPAELDVLLCEFKAGIRAYLEARGQPGMRSLSDLIAFDQALAAEELKYFGQELFLQAEAKGPLDDPKYLAALARSRELSRSKGIDAIMDRHKLDALVAPTVGPPWKIDVVCGDHYGGGSSTPSAMAGYPIIDLPAGHAFGLPVGISLFGRPSSEPVLLRIAYAFEQATRARRRPAYRPSAEAG